MSFTHSTQRFSDRVENYVRYRPGYPEGVLHLLREKTGLSDIRSAQQEGGEALAKPLLESIADVGSGTGISTRLFLQNGNVVFGVEPNAEMRQAVETFLKDYPQFRSVVGTAEATTLADHSVGYVVAAQAFHWFDSPQTKHEFARILKPGGWAVLIWNSRRIHATPFLRDYEALLQQYGTDYREIRHKNIRSDRLKSFFSEGKFELYTFDNQQLFDFKGLKGRLLSSSYTPNEQHSDFEPMVRSLKRIFEQYEQNGTVRIEYDTRVYFGHVG